MRNESTAKRLLLNGLKHTDIKMISYSLSNLKKLCAAECVLKF